MLRLDLICLTNSGISAARITTVSPTMDSTQAQPEDGPSTAPNSEWKPDSSSDVIQYSGAMMKLPRSPRKENTQAP